MSEARRLSEIEKRAALKGRISELDFQALFALGSFDCPKDSRRDPRACDGTDCPSRSAPLCGCQDRAHVDQPYRCPWREDDYFDECRRALRARAILMVVNQGEVRVG